jgi:ABC-type dipeptide/oligopeptide/nickel transport system ATPase component
MQDGRVIEAAPVQQVFATPTHSYTQMLLEANLDDTAPRPPLRQPTAARHPVPAQEPR